MSNLGETYFIMVYASAIVFVTGVPVAKNTPCPLRLLWMDCVLMDMLIARCDSPFLIPLMLAFLVTRGVFLNMCASSTRRASTPISSKVNAES